MALGSMITKVFKLKKLKKRDYDPEIVDIQDIIMPTIYNNMDLTITNVEAKSELKSYKSLCYRFRTIQELTELKEYHAFQIGILLNAIKLKVEFKIDKPQDYIHKDIVNLDKRTINGKVSDLIKRFDKEIKKTSSENMLKKELLFTPIDASYLLYYLSFYYIEETI
jgi:hypothetical protein